MVLEITSLSLVAYIFNLKRKWQRELQQLIDSFTKQWMQVCHAYSPLT